MKILFSFMVTALVGFSALAQSVKTQILVSPPQGVYLSAYHMNKTILSNVEGGTDWYERRALDWQDMNGVSGDAGGLGMVDYNGGIIEQYYWPVVAWPQWENAGVTWWEGWPGDGNTHTWTVTTNSSEVGPVTQLEHNDTALNYSYPPAVLLA